MGEKSQKVTTQDVAQESQAVRDLYEASAALKEWKEKAILAMQKLGDVRIQVDHTSCSPFEGCIYTYSP